MSQSSTSTASPPEEMDPSLLARMCHLEAVVSTAVETMSSHLDQRLTELAVTLLEEQQQSTELLLAQLRGQASERASGKLSSHGADPEGPMRPTEPEQSLPRPSPPRTPCAPASSGPSEIDASREEILRSLDEIPKLGASLSRLDLSLATTRSELLQALETQASPAPALSTNEALLDELKTLWRKQEVYVLGLRAGLKNDLEEMHLELRGQIRTDAKAEQEGTRTALGAVVRQALGKRPRPSPQPQPEESPRTPIGGIVLLSSVTSALVTLGALWLLR